MGKMMSGQCITTKGQVENWKRDICKRENCATCANQLEIFVITRAAAMALAGTASGDVLNLSIQVTW
ncbi:hypothetical protein MTO96_035675 [Rhipicephalus appendiculatus]